MKIYIVVNSQRRGKEAIQAVFTNQIKALKYVEKWKAIGQQGLQAYVFKPNEFDKASEKDWCQRCEIWVNPKTHPCFGGGKDISHKEALELGLKVEE